jgi:MotA/TolQ/ExbB proton channel family
VSSEQQRPILRHRSLWALQRGFSALWSGDNLGVLITILAAFIVGGGIAAAVFSPGAIPIYGSRLQSIDLALVPGAAIVLAFWFPMLGGARRMMSVLGVFWAEQRVLGEALIQINEFLKGNKDFPRKAEETPFVFTGGGEFSHRKLTAAYIMLTNLHQDDNVRRFDPVHLIVSRVESLISQGAVGIKSWQMTALRLGILGTFLGMVFALSDIPRLFDADREISAMAVAPLVENLALAFGTSISGLFAAVFLQILANAARLREEDVLLAFQDVASGVQKVYREIVEVQSFDAELTDLIEAMRIHREDTREMISQQEKQTAAQLTHVESVAKTLHANVSDFENALGAPIQQLADASRTVQTSIASNAAAMEKLSMLTAGVTEFEERTVEAFRNAVTELNNQQSQIASVQAEAIQSARDIILKEIGEGTGLTVRLEREEDLNLTIRQLSENLSKVTRQQLRGMMSISVLLVVILALAVFVVVFLPSI